MQNRLCIIVTAIMFASSAQAEEYETRLDFESLFPNISEAAQKLDAKLHKKKGGKLLTQEELRHIKSRVTASLSTKRQTTLMEIRRYCDDDITTSCGHYEQFSDSIRTCITSHRHNFSARCNQALRDNIGERLIADTLIDGLMIPEGSKLLYDAYNNVKGAISSRKSTYNGILFKSGEIHFSNGVVTYAKLPYDTRIQGILFKGLDKQAMLFHPNGTVKRGMLAQDTTYQGLPLKAHSYIQLHPNRYFQSGILAQDISIGTRTYRANSYLYANQDGEMSDDHTILLKHTLQKNTNAD